MFEDDIKNEDQNLINTKVEYYFAKIKILPESLDFIKKMEQDYPLMTNEFKKICITNYITFLKKQHDYGPYNISLNTQLKTEDEKRLSLTALVVRINDKISRLINLVIHNKQNKNESIYDSFLDTSIYSIISMIVINDKWGK